MYPSTLFCVDLLCSVSDTFDYIQNLSHVYNFRTPNLLFKAN